MQCVKVVLGPAERNRGSNLRNELQENWDEVGWGIMLINATKVFKKTNRTAMFWHVHHTWPSGARFSFNTYRHWKFLIIQGRELILHLKEGFMQVDPLLMILYELGMLLIIQELQHHFLYL